jgi:hypothetical protein
MRGPAGGGGRGMTDRDDMAVEVARLCERVAALERESQKSDAGLEKALDRLAAEQKVQGLAIDALRQFQVLIGAGLAIGAVILPKVIDLMISKLFGG